MAKTDAPADRHYTKDHEWALSHEGKQRIGVTAYAVDQLGDITLVNIDVKVGATLEAGKAFGTIESVKTLSDLFAPMTGTVTSINAELESKPELINEDCYGKGWMIEIAPSGPAADLLDAQAYGALLASGS